MQAGEAARCTHTLHARSPARLLQVPEALGGKVVTPLSGDGLIAVLTLRDGSKKFMDCPVGWQVVAEGVSFVEVKHQIKSRGPCSGTRAISTFSSSIMAVPPLDLAAYQAEFEALQRRLQGHPISPVPLAEMPPYHHMDQAGGWPPLAPCLLCAALWLLLPANALIQLCAALPAAAGHQVDSAVTTPELLHHHRGGRPADERPPAAGPAGPAAGSQRGARDGCHGGHP